MTTLRDIFNAFAPEYLERYPHLPTSHHKAISAIQQCQSGHYGHSLSQCPSCGGHHRVNHACGNRHCPQCQQQNTQQWLYHNLEQQLPGPHFLLTCTVPETPYVFRVAISNRRIVSLKERTVAFTYRQVGSARLRTAHLDAMECIRRFLQHVLPDGCVKVRHVGLLHASCAIPLATIRLMIVPAHPSDGQPPQRSPPQALAVRCPTCGAPMHVVLRLWTATNGFVDTG